MVEEEAISVVVEFLVIHQQLHQMQMVVLVVVVLAPPRLAELEIE